MSKTEETLINDLRLAGYSYTGINDLFNQPTLPLKAVEIILQHLPAVYAEHLGSGEHLVRSLISAEQPFDPTVLIKLFEESSYNMSIKCTIAYVLAISKTHDISGWMKEQLLQRQSSFERSGLLDGIAKKAAIKDREEFMETLRALFDKYCRFETYLKLYQRYATTDDIPFLEEKLKQPDLTIYREYAIQADKLFGGNQTRKAEQRFTSEVSKLIEAIKKRKRHYSFPK
ncbi:MAG: hypothetical protein QM731_03045 [Chitinophagaceae bacterium]